MNQLKDDKKREMQNNGTKLLKEKTIADSLALDAMLSNISIPPIPANRMQLLEIVRKPNEKINIDDLTRLLSADPGLFAMMLQLANSSYYRGVEKIVSLRGAITRIGLLDTINSISFFCVKNALPSFPVLNDLSHEDYWAFTWTCAMAARRLGHPNLGMNVIPGELYMAGLLHGIGKLMMAIHHPEKIEKCFIKTNRTGQPQYKSEQEIFGTINGFLAAKIMNSWNFPDNICFGVKYYQIPESAPPQYRELAGLIQFACELSSKTGIGFNGIHCDVPLSSTYIGQQSHLLLSREEVQTKIIQEIKKTARQKYDSMTDPPLHEESESLSDKPITRHSSNNLRHENQFHGFFFGKIVSFLKRTGWI